MPIEVPADAPCAFCDYLSGRRPYTILLRASLSAVLVTKEQRGKGHVLVLPLVHRPTILDVTDEEVAELAVMVKLMAKAIDRTYARPGIAVWQNNGIPANQSVGHVHFHVAGTVEGGGTHWGDVEELAVSETDRICDLLRDNLCR